MPVYDVTPDYDDRPRPAPRANPAVTICSDCTGPDLRFEVIGDEVHVDVRYHGESAVPPFVVDARTIRSAFSYIDKALPYDPRPPQD